MDVVRRFLNDLGRTFGLADAIDVLLVAAFLYIVIGWVRRSSSGSASRRLVVVGGIFAAVYILAAIFNLTLVEGLLQILALVFAFAAVVVFQSDIRRMLDRLGEWGFSRRGDALPASEMIEHLTEAVARLAEERTGALIAIRGSEPWSGYIQGGVPLDGAVSRPLLYSIFDERTAGHDGAVLIEGERITSFAAHLPLARHLPQQSRFGGTRHAAALGLAEECDALVIAVSEERGTISIAQNGELTVLGSAGELGERLSGFWREHYGEERARAHTGWSRANVQTAVMSVALAIIAWFTFAYSPVTVQRTYDVPIAFQNVPATWTLERDTVREVAVTLEGPQQVLSTIREQELLILFDLSDPEPGVNELVIGEDNIELPSEVDLYAAAPREITVTAHPHRAVTLPVRVRTVGPVPDSLRLMPEADTVTVLFSAEVENPPERALTEPINLQQAAGGTITTTFALPPGVHLPPGRSGLVTVRIERRPEPDTVDAGL